MQILFWLDKFPAFSETFIRDQIVCLLNQNAQIKIHTRSGQANISQLESLSGFETYKLEDKIININTHFHENKTIRIYNFLKIILQNLFSKNLKYYLKTINVKDFGKEAKSLKLFFKVHFILKNKISIIHAHFGPNGNQALVFKKLQLPIKLYTTFHGYDIRLGQEKGGGIYKDLFSYSDGVFSISNFNGKNLLSFGASKNKIFPLSNGINIEFFKRKKPILSSKKIKIVTVARLVEEKTLHIAIKAICQVLKKLPNLDFEYKIIGEGEKRKDLQKLINQLGLTDNIKLLGAKNSTQVRDLLVASDLFLLSSKAEALPTVLLEAQAAGLVILATNVGSVSDIVKSGLVVEPENIESFTKGLIELFANKKQWVALAQIGEEYVNKNHNLTAQTKKLVQYYKQ